MKKQKKILIICIAAAVVAIGIIAGVIMAQPGEADPTAAESAYQEMQDAVIGAKVDPYDNIIDFEALWDINEDVIAWITVPNTNVNYPVLYSTEKDDSYYLEHTIDGKSGYPGTIYIEKYNSSSFTDPVTIMYGHTLTKKYPGTMFSELHKFEDKEFFEDNPYFYVYMPEATLKYRVFSAVAFDDRYILASYDFDKEGEFDQYIDDLNSSMTGNVDDEVEVKYGDGVLTLSTCITNHPSQRWLINAVLEDLKILEEE